MRVWMGMAISFGAGYKAVVDWGVRLGVGKLDDLRANDFYSRIRAVLIDRGNESKWSQTTLDGVTAEIVDDHFASLGDSYLEAVTLVVGCFEKVSSSEDLVKAHVPARLRVHLTVYQ